MRNNGEWTEARFRSFVTSALRAASRRWPVKFKALKESFVGRTTNIKTGKIAMHYKCAGCNKHFVAADVQVDHVKPVVDPVKGFISWDVYIDNLFCELENLQILCKGCHKEKTATEKLMRKKK
jgi:5-methylcytosine-specific restriction endonuclease McrA